MESLKCFLAMSLALVIFGTIVAFEPPFLSFVETWKDTINTITNVVLAGSILYAARQFYLSYQISCANSADRLLVELPALEKLLYNDPELFRYVTSKKINIARIKHRADRWFHDLTRHYIRAHIFHDRGILEETDMNIIKRDIRSRFQTESYQEYWEEYKDQYEQEDIRFFNLMERQRLIAFREIKEKELSAAVGNGRA